MSTGFPKAITCDLDSTLADTTQRWHLYNGADTDWVAYAAACAEDGLMESTAALLRVLGTTHEVWIVSGRHESSRSLTETWLQRFGITYAGLILAGDNHDTFESHAHYKLAMIKEVERMAQKSVIMHLDDLPKVGAFLRSQGYHCVVIDPMYPKRGGV